MSLHIHTVQPVAIPTVVYTSMSVATAAFSGAYHFACNKMHTVTM